MTLLGQNVNSYGRDVGSGFAELLRAVDAVDGIERIRFTSPHPKDFRRDVIAAMAECAAVCEHAHLPLQSGSTRVLKAMRRTYSRERYVEARRRAAGGDPRPRARRPTSSSAFRARPSATSRETLEVVEEVGFDGAFTFVYSPRAGTEAAAMPDQVPDEVKRERIERLVEVVQRVAAERNTGAGRDGRGGARRGPQPHRPRVPARPHTPQHDRQLHGRRPSPGELVPVAIESATSTTLAGAQLALAAV